MRPNDKRHAMSIFARSSNGRRASVFKALIAGSLLTMASAASASVVVALLAERRFRSPG